MISVIIPAYNEEKYIEETINSIRNQDFDDYELIVVCDGCSDNTLEIVKGKADKVFVVKKRKGPAYARNVGARRSKGDILLFLDADTKLSESVLKSINESKDSWIIGTCKALPSNLGFKHRFFYGFKNMFVCPMGVSNGILFIKRLTFGVYGGFDESLEKCEEGVLVRNVKKHGSFIILDAHVVNSTRRFENKGYFNNICYWISNIFNSKKPYEFVR